MALLAFALLCASACGGEEAGVPQALMDGSRAAPPTVELQGLDAPPVLARADVVRRPATSARAASCLELWDRDPEPVSVERVGVRSESVTFREHGRQAVFGCDSSRGQREDDRRWCGSAYGVLHEGRLLDPRVDVLCTTEEGDPLGFAWIQPGPGTRFVTVRQPGYVEVHEVVSELPIRVSTTTGIDLSHGAVSVQVTEHGASGRLLRRYRVDAAVAG